MYRSIYELTDYEIDKLLYVNDISCSPNDNKLLKLEQNSIFTVFIPHYNKYLSNADKPHPTLKSHVISKPTFHIPSRPTSKFAFKSQPAKIDINKRNVGTQYNPSTSQLPENKVVDDNVVVCEKHTRIATGIKNVSDEVCTTLGVLNNLHVSNSIDFGNFKISAVAHTINVYDTSNIELPSKLREVILIINAKHDINIHFNTDSSMSIKNYRILVVNDTDNEVIYKNMTLSHPKSVTLHHFYIIFGNIYVGYKHTSSFSYFSYEDKLKLINFKQIKPTKFSDWKKFLSPDYCNVLNPEDYENVVLSLSLFKNFIIILDSNNVQKVLSLVIEKSDYDIFGEIIVYNKNDHDVSIESEFFDKVCTSQSRLLLSYACHDHDIVFEDPLIIVNGDEVNITLLIQNYDKSVRNNNVFWLVDSTSFNEPLKPYKISNNINNDNNKFSTNIENTQIFEIKWFLNPNKTYVLRNSQTSRDGTLLFKILDDERSILHFRGQYNLKSNTDGFFLMRINN